MLVSEKEKRFFSWASDYKWNFPCSNFQLMWAALIPYNTAWYWQNWIWIATPEQAWLTLVRWTRVIPLSSSHGGSWLSWGITGCTQISIEKQFFYYCLHSGELATLCILNSFLVVMLVRLQLEKEVQMTWKSSRRRKSRKWHMRIARLNCFIQRIKGWR